MRLTVELVPRTTWWTNVRSKISRKDWEKCKDYSKAKTNGTCILCGGSGLTQGRRYATEAHEVWAYDDTRKIQTLVDIIPICPRCHQVKHMGRSRAVSDPRQWAELIQHFMDVNEMNEGNGDAITEYLMNAFDVWERRSQFEWELDVSFLEKLGVELDGR